jgi:hypothetical protein
MLHGMGIHTGTVLLFNSLCFNCLVLCFFTLWSYFVLLTGVDLNAVVEAGAFISSALGRTSGSKVNIAMSNKAAKAAKAKL